jgi:hypothetical protein
MGMETAKALVSVAGRVMAWGQCRRLSAETDGEQQDRRGLSLTGLATRACARGLVLPQAVRIDRDIGHADIAYFHLERVAQHRKASRFIRNRHHQESERHQGARNDDHRYQCVSNRWGKLSASRAGSRTFAGLPNVQTADHRATPPAAPSREGSARFPQRPHNNHRTEPPVQGRPCSSCG